MEKYSEFVKDEQTGIIYRKWQSPLPEAVLLLVHGLGAHSGRWEFLADFFLNKNISSYAIELRGFGQANGLKGHIDSFDIYFQDIKSLYRIIKQENNGKRVILIGESLGALIGFLLAIKQPSLFDGLICISPAFKSRIKFPLMHYIRILFYFFFNPRKQFSIPFVSAMCTRDTEYQKKMDLDYREHRLGTLKLLLNILAAQIRAGFLKNKLKTPVLFLIAGEDLLVDPKTSRDIFKGLKIEDKEIILYPEMYHALSIDLGREKVFEDICRWMLKRI